MRIPKKEPSQDPVIERILALLRSQNKTQKDLTVYLHIANGSFTRWIYSNSKTYMKYIVEIASYLGVSQNDLLYGNLPFNPDDPLSAAEVEIISTFRMLDQAGRNAVLDITRLAKKASANNK